MSKKEENKEKKINIKKCENNNLKEDLRFNIERANEIVRLSENRRYKFLEINLALTTAFSFLLVYVLDNFNVAGKLSMITSITIYFTFTLKNIIYNLRENTTRIKKESICSSKEWDFKCFKKKMENVSEYPFKDDYKDQLINLHEYQKNYNKIGKNTRINTFTGLIVLLLTFFISLIINSLGYDKVDCFGIFAIIFLYNSLPPLVIWGIIWCWKWCEKKREREKLEFIEIPIPKGKSKEYIRIIDKCIKFIEKNSIEILNDFLD